MGDIFLEMIDLIEKRTDLPILERELENWLRKSDKNKAIYEIYELASKLSG